MRYSPGVGPMLGRRREHRADIDPTLGQCIMFAWYLGLLTFESIIQDSNLGLCLYSLQ